MIMRAPSSHPLQPQAVPTIHGLEFAYALYRLPPGRLPFSRWRWELWHGSNLVAAGWRLARPDAGRALRVRAAEFGHRLFDATGGGGSVQLLTDGRDIYARTAGGAFFNLLRTPAQPLLVVGDEGLLKDLSASIRPRRRRRVSGSERSSRGRRPAAE